MFEIIQGEKVNETTAGGGPEFSKTTIGVGHISDLEAIGPRKPWIGEAVSWPVDAQPWRSGFIAELATALAQAQLEFKVAKKDGFNPHLKNKFATRASLVRAAGPALKKYGLSVVHLPSSSGTRLSVKTVLLHKSGQYLTADMETLLKTGTPQEAGSAITYFSRYGYKAITGMDQGDEEDDGQQYERSSPVAPAVPTYKKFTGKKESP